MVSIRSAIKVPSRDALREARKAAVLGRLCGGLRDASVSTKKIQRFKKKRGRDFGEPQKIEQEKTSENKKVELDFRFASLFINEFFKMKKNSNQPIHDGKNIAIVKRGF